MPISFVDAQAAYDARSAGSGTLGSACTKPTGTALNDILVAFIGTLRSFPTGIPSGFSNLASILIAPTRWGSPSLYTSLYWKRATASEPATYTFTGDYSVGLNTPVQFVTQLAAFRGVERFDGTATSNGMTHPYFITGLGHRSEFIQFGQPNPVTLGNAQDPYAGAFQAQRPGLLLYSGVESGDSTDQVGSLSTPSGMTAMAGSGQYNSGNMGNYYLAAYKTPQMAAGAVAVSGTAGGGYGGGSSDGYAVMLVQLAESFIGISD